MNTIKYIILVSVILSSCSTAKLAVPEKFIAVADKMPIKGVNSWVFNQKLSFGKYQTSKVKRGWTSSTDGSAILGHHDRTGPTGDNWAKSWNFSHQSAGCSQQALNSTGGAGRLYCFAAN